MYLACMSSLRRYSWHVHQGGDANLCCFVICSTSERHFTWSKIRPVFQKTYEMVVAFMGKHRWKEKNVMYSWFSPLSDPENIKWVVEINIPDQLLRKVFQTPRSMSRSPCT